MLATRPSAPSAPSASSASSARPRRALACIGTCFIGCARGSPFGFFGFFVSFVVGAQPFDSSLPSSSCARARSLLRCARFFRVVESVSSGGLACLHCLLGNRIPPLSSRQQDSSTVFSVTGFLHCLLGNRIPPLSSPRCRAAGGPSTRVDALLGLCRRTPPLQYASLVFVDLP